MRRLAEMGARMLVRGLIAAADVPARFAHAEMYPGASGREAVFAAGDLIRKDRHLNGVEVRADRYFHHIATIATAVRDAVDDGVDVSVLPDDFGSATPPPSE
jgi:hypothetical protein